MKPAAKRQKCVQMQLAPDQEAALALLETHRHLAVFGKPGTGKTALRNAFAKQHRCVVLGPTGTSVENTENAYTIARFMGATEKTAGDPGALARNMRLPFNIRDHVLLIDEVGMVAAFDFVALDAGLKRALRSKEPFGGLRVVLIGDLFQLRPPTQTAITYFFETAAYADLVQNGLVVHNLTTQHRQKAGVNGNTRFLPFLDEARLCSLGVESEELLGYLNTKYYDESALHLYARRADAARHNARMLRERPGQLRRVCGFECKVGARVVLTRNCYKKSQLAYTNGTFGYVDAVGHDYVDVSMTTVNKTHRIQARKGVLPVSLAWATTIHKVQGKTLHNVVVHGDNMFEAGQAYVAVSRASSLTALATRNLHADDFKMPFLPKVVQYARKNKIT